MLKADVNLMLPCKGTLCKQDIILVYSSVGADNT